MRIAVVSWLIIWGFSLNSSAQYFDAGFIFGVAATQVDGDGNSGYNKAGPVAGIWVNRGLGNPLFVRFEIRYIQKGSFAKTIQDGATIGHYRIRLNYLEIPFNIGYIINSKFNVFGGTSIGYLVKAKEMNEFGSFPQEDIEKFRKFEFTLRFGLEYKYSEHLTISVMHSYSILPVRPHKGNVTYRWNRGQYNNVIELQAICEI